MDPLQAQPPTQPAQNANRPTTEPTTGLPQARSQKTKGLQQTHPTPTSPAGMQLRRTLAVTRRATDDLAETSEQQRSERAAGRCRHEQVRPAVAAGETLVEEPTLELGRAQRADVAGAVKKLTGADTDSRSPIPPSPLGDRRRPSQPRPAS